MKPAEDLTQNRSDGSGNNKSNSSSLKPRTPFEATPVIKEATKTFGKSLFEITDTISR
jgi:hypothetical protein